MVKTVADHIPGYTYGTHAVLPSPVSLEELQALKMSVGLQRGDGAVPDAGRGVLQDQTQQLVHH